MRTTRQKHKSRAREQEKRHDRRVEKKALPTFTNAPVSMLPSDLISFKMRMEQLDLDHSRARSPAARMRIETKMRELRADLKKLEKAEIELDEAAKKWWAGIEATLAAVLGPESKTIH